MLWNKGKCCEYLRTTIAWFIIRNHTNNRSSKFKEIFIKRKFHLLSKIFVNFPSYFHGTLITFLNQMYRVLGSYSFSLKHFLQRNWIDACKSNEKVLILMVILILLFYLPSWRNIFVQNENAYLKMNIIEKPILKKINK